MLKNKIVLLALTTALLGGAAVAKDIKDWRKSGSAQQKLENLVEIVPSTAQIMVDVGARYQNIYWAGKLGQWRFAQYQLDELTEMIEVLQLASPKREQTAQVFLDEALGQFKPAIEKQDWVSFERAFNHMRAHCIQCHEANDHAYIVPPRHPVTAPSVILNLQ